MIYVVFGIAVPEFFKPIIILATPCHPRARPIATTSFAVEIEMAPALLGIGAGSELRVPMALAVTGGLIASTTLSLILIYGVVEDLETWMRQPLARVITALSYDHPRAWCAV